MVSVVVDDHLLRDVLAGERTSDLDGLAPGGIATTGLWFFRLCSSLARPEVTAALTPPTLGLSTEAQAGFRRAVTALPAAIEVLAMRELAWSMAELQHRHRSHGRAMSAAMVEALAAAHRLGAAIAVSKRDVGPTLKASAEADGIAFHCL